MTTPPRTVSDACRKIANGALRDALTEAYRKDYLTPFHRNVSAAYTLVRCFFVPAGILVRT